MYLSCSGFRCYEHCPFQYWHRYINKTVLAVPDNRLNTIFGSTVGVLFERFYVERMWQRPKTVAQELRDLVEVTVERVIAKECRKGGRVDFTEPGSMYSSREDLVRDVQEVVGRGLLSIKHHRLLGSSVGAEVVLDHRKGGHLLGGRADFIMDLKQGGSTLSAIIDGKGTKYRERYTKDLQLLWYAMLYREAHGRCPGRLGYLYWRCAPDKALDWIPFTESQVDNLLEAVLSKAGRIEADKCSLDSLPGQHERTAARHQLFFPTPGAECTFCAYRSVCEVGTKYVAAAGADVKVVFGVEEVIGV